MIMKLKAHTPLCSAPWHFVVLAVDAKLKVHVKNAASASKFDWCVVKIMQTTHCTLIDFSNLSKLILV